MKKTTINEIYPGVPPLSKRDAETLILPGQETNPEALINTPTEKEPDSPRWYVNVAEARELWCMVCDVSFYVHVDRATQDCPQCGSDDTIHQDDLFMIAPGLQRSRVPKPDSNTEEFLVKIEVRE